METGDVRICSHPGFAAKVAVNRLEDIGEFSADVTIKCRECGTPFTFIGVGGGLSRSEPRVSMLGIELRCPIRPLSPMVDEELNARLNDEEEE